MARPADPTTVAVHADLPAMPLGVVVRVLGAADFRAFLACDLWEAECLRFLWAAAVFFDDLREATVLPVFVAFLWAVAVVFFAAMQEPWSAQPASAGIVMVNASKAAAKSPANNRVFISILSNSTNEGWMNSARADFISTRSPMFG